MEDLSCMCSSTLNLTGACRGSRYRTRAPGHLGPLPLITKPSRSYHSTVYSADRPCPSSGADDAGGAGVWTPCTASTQLRPPATSRITARLPAEGLLARRSSFVWACLPVTSPPHLIRAHLRTAKGATLTCAAPAVLRAGPVGGTAPSSLPNPGISGSPPGILAAERR